MQNHYFSPRNVFTFEPTFVNDSFSLFGRSSRLCPPLVSAPAPTKQTARALQLVIALATADWKEAARYFFKVCLCEGPAALEPRALELATAPADECLFHLARQEMQMCHFWHPPLPSPLSSKSRSYYRTTQFSSSCKPAVPTVRCRYKSGQWIAFHLFWRPFVSLVKIHFFYELTDKKNKNDMFDEKMIKKKQIQILNQDL